MDMTAAASSPQRNDQLPKPEVRVAVKDLLLKSASFGKLPAATQQQIAHDMTKIADYIAAPEGIPGNELPSARAMDTIPQADPNAAKSTYGDDVKQVNKIGDGPFVASGARAGAEVAGVLLQKVNFPTFCSSLIEGVFHAIVKANLEQMEQYGKLVASVAKSLNTFRDENVTDNQGRDQLVEQFPDTFEIGSSDGGGFGDAPAGPRVRLREGVDEDAALKKVNASLPMEGGPLKSLALDDEETEQKLVQAARTQLATSRQQLLATMVLMGISRIVVTDGKIQAKIMYDFQARDNMKRQRSAVARDYARDQYGNVQRTYGSEGDYENKTDGGSRSADTQQDASSYSKGTYKYSEQPIITAMSTASEASEAALQTRAQLAGVMDINFKSDYFPLEKMADSFQISQIQNAAKPGRGAGPAAAGASASPPPPPPAAQPAAQPPK
jgi:hypothetical protein